MDPGRKGQAAQGTTRAVQRVQHEQVVQIARLLARQRDAPFHDPLAEHLDLLADHVVDGSHDIQAEPRPRIDRQQRRDVVVVQLRHRFALAGTLDPGDRQQLVSGQLVGRQGQAEIEVPQRHRLVVAARTLVRQRQFRADIAMLVRMLAAGDVRPPQRQIGNRQEHGHFAGLLKRRLQIDSARALPRVERHDRAVLHAGVAGLDLDLIVGQRLAADLDRPHPVVVVAVPTLADRDQLGPMPIRRLEMVRLQKHAFEPMDRQISHRSAYRE
jgi:hypothetical protein